MSYNNIDFYSEYLEGIEQIKLFNLDINSNSDNLKQGFLHLKKASEINPEDPDVYGYLSYCLFLFNNDSGAKYYLDKAIDLKSKTKIVIQLKAILNTSLSEKNSINNNQNSDIKVKKLSSIKRLKL